MKKNLLKILAVWTMTGLCYASSKAQNVGIGTATPSSRLEVVGVSNTTSGTVMHLKSLNGTSLLLVRNDGSIGVGAATGPARMRINSNNSNNNIDLLFNEAYRGGLNTNDSAMVISSATNNVCFTQPCPVQNRLIIQPPTSSGGILLSFPGRVGMFTNTPQTSFHVNGNMLLGGHTTSPASGYRLNVEGKIICEEVRVQLTTAWPDYVFSPDYPLLPVTELEQKVKAQKHLPGVPSAAEVEALKGFDMGETQRILLEKIEELYLYMFQMNNRMETLEQENKMLKEKG